MSAIALRAIETVDFMTADLVCVRSRFLEACGLAIVNEVDGVARVTYDHSKPPATVEWE